MARLSVPGDATKRHAANSLQQCQPPSLSCWLCPSNGCTWPGSSLQRLREGLHWIPGQHKGPGKATTSCSSCPSGTSEDPKDAPAEALTSMGVGGALVPLVLRQEVQLKEFGESEVDNTEFSTPLGLPAFFSQTWEGKEARGANPRAPTRPWPQLGTHAAPSKAVAGTHATGSPDSGWLYWAPGVRHSVGLALNSPLGRRWGPAGMCLFPLFRTRPLRLPPTLLPLSWWACSAQSQA